MTSTCIDILLAEDDEDLREAMVDTLHEAGYTVEAVGNGRRLDHLRWSDGAPGSSIQAFSSSMVCASTAS